MDLPAGTATVVVTADLKPFEERWAAAHRLTEENTRQAEQTFAKSARAIDDMSSSAQSYAKQLQVVSDLQQRINAVTGVKDPLSSAGVSAARAGDIEAYATALDDVRAKYNPLFAAQQRYQGQLTEINQALRTGALSQQEHATATTRVEAAYRLSVAEIEEADKALQGLTPTVRLNGNQIAELGHIARSTFGTLMAGGSVFQALGYESNRLVSVLTIGSGGVGGTLKAIGGLVAGLLDPLALAAAGVGGIGVAAVASVASFQSAQRDITLALAGIGRASGTTRDQINDIANATASLTGLSVSEARIAASAFASLGKVAHDAIMPAVAVTHDLALTLGSDSTEAAQLLAKALADPARGVDDLNGKLAAWSDRTRTLIINLAAQGKVLEADRLIIQGVHDSTVAASEVTGFWGAAWHVAGNLASNSMDALGRALSDLTGIGATLESQLADAKARLDELSKWQANGLGFLSGASLEQARAEVARLTAEIDRNAAASKQAAATLKSLQAATAIRAAVPEIGRREDLRSQIAAVRSAADLSAGSLSPEVAAAADQSLARLEAQLANVKSVAQASIDASNQAIASVNARSPGEIASITRQQTYNQLVQQGMSVSEAATAADRAADAARLTAQERLNESARNRFAAVRDAIGQSQIDTEAIGKSSSQVELLRANWQAYTDLRRESEQNHIAFDDAQYQRLVRENQTLAQQSMLREGAQLRQDLQTPDQLFAKQVDNLKALYDADAINYDTYMQAKSKATLDHYQGTYGQAFSLAESALDAWSGSLNSQSKKEFQIQKDLSVAVAVLKGLEAIPAAYAAGTAIGGPFVGAAFAAVAAATTAGQIAAIRSQSFGGSASVPSVGASPSIPAPQAGSSSTSKSAQPAPGKTVIIQGNYFQYDREGLRKMLYELDIVMADGVGSQGAFF